MPNASRKFSFQVRSLLTGAVVTDHATAFGGETDEDGNTYNHEVEWAFPPGDYTWESIVSERTGIWRYAKLLPVSGGSEMLTLGEGQTPLIKLRDGEQLAGHANLYVKNESQNPTWSHKDRLAAAGVSKALELGAKAVTVASTGNQAAATAAYAARAGLPCFIFTNTTVPEAMKALAQSLGAYVVAADDTTVRSGAMVGSYREFGWWPMGNVTQPPVGSNCFGVEGYKTVAFELFEQFGHDVPEVVVIPTANGDLAYGTHKGFRELQALGLTSRLPRVVAVEPFSSLTESVAKGVLSPVPSSHERKTAAFSTAMEMGTHQALLAIRQSGGTAISVRSEGEILQAQAALGATNGLFVEASSATAIAAVRQLSTAGWFGAEDRVVVVTTSTGLKDPAAARAHHGPIPLISSTDPQHVRGVIQERYGIDCANL